MNSQNNPNSVICACGESIGLMTNQKALVNHIKACESYKAYGSRIETYRIDPHSFIDIEDLYVLRAELFSDIISIEKQIIAKNGILETTVEQILNPPPRMSMQQQYSNRIPQNVFSNQQNKVVQNKTSQVVPQHFPQQNTKVNQNMYFMQPAVVVESFENKTMCCSCKKYFDNSADFTQLCFLQNCDHIFCKSCILSQINNEYLKNSGEIFCKICRAPIQSSIVRHVIGRNEFVKLDEKLSHELIDLTVCVKCDVQIDFQVGDIDSLVLNKEGVPLVDDALIHYSFNRFVCPNQQCKTEQCKSCQAVPYHLGQDCQQFLSFKSTKRCRYCNNEIPAGFKRNQPALSDICNSDDCEKKVKFACQKVLKCGHGCNGILNESTCLPCLKEDCAKNDASLNGIDGEEYCNICFVEGLINAPVIRSSCGHMFHFECLKKKLEMKWVSPRIVFTFCSCPLCKKWLDLPRDSALSQILVGYQQLFNSLQDKASKRLKHEGREKDEKLTKVGSFFYQKPNEYAMAIYSYYMCFKCAKPYFGGLKDCERALIDDQKEYSPKDLICPNCCEIPIQKCGKHGDDFIEFKCKYCCSIAVWFCFSTTHFCDPCHQKVGVVMKQTADQLPKCQGKNGCPFKGAHNPNGQESALGCSICRNIKMLASDF